MKVVPVAEREKLIVRKQEDGTYQGWWVEVPNEIVKGPNDIDVIGQLCCIRMANIGVYIEWQDPDGTVV